MEEGFVGFAVLGYASLLDLASDDLGLGLGKTRLDDEFEDILWEIVYGLFAEEHFGNVRGTEKEEECIEVRGERSWN